LRTRRRLDPLGKLNVRGGRRQIHGTISADMESAMREN
jgi:hypothetical protein